MLAVISRAMSVVVPKTKLAEVEYLLNHLEELGVKTEDAAARINEAVADWLSVGAERSRLAYRAHRILRELQGDARREGA